MFSKTLVLSIIDWINGSEKHAGYIVSFPTNFGKFITFEILILVKIRVHFSTLCLNI